MPNPNNMLLGVGDGIGGIGGISGYGGIDGLGGLDGLNGLDGDELVIVPKR